MFQTIKGFIPPLLCFACFFVCFALLCISSMQSSHKPTQGAMTPWQWRTLRYIYKRTLRYNMRCLKAAAIQKSYILSNIVLGLSKYSHSLWIFLTTLWKIIQQFHSNLYIRFKTFWHSSFMQFSNMKIATMLMCDISECKNFSNL